MKLRKNSFCSDVIDLIVLLSQCFAQDRRCGGSPFELPSNLIWFEVDEKNYFEIKFKGIHLIATSAVMLNY